MRIKTMVMMMVLLLSVWNSTALGERIDKIEQCGVQCSQEFPCKAKSYLSFGQCKRLPDDMNREAFSNTSISPVMKCKGRQQCSLHLRVSTAIQINKHVNGILMCMAVAGMMERCRVVNLRAGKMKFVNKQGQNLIWHKNLHVNIEDNCLEVGPGQDVHLTLRTSPQFCEVFYSKSYQVPDCSNHQMRRNVPECITGSIHYTVASERRELIVSVKDMLEDRDYHLRLCRKGYICTGTGSHALIKRENPLKNAILPFSKPVPCLCIEGWSVMADAPRIQVCPFKDRVEELWSGITFDPIEETLSWEAECHISAVITLCEFQEGGTCSDLDGSSQRYLKGKITYSAVDAHPQLCMKFTTEAEFWVRCPFTEGNFPAWTLKMTTQEGHPQLLVTSLVNIRLSLSMCTKSETITCEDINAILVNVEKLKPVQPNLDIDLCDPSHCIKATRVDVRYAVTSLFCQPSCSYILSKSIGRQEELQLMYIVPVVVLLSAVIMVIVVMGIVAIVFKIKQITKTRNIVCLPGPHTGSFSPMMEQSDSETQLARKSIFYDT